MVEPPTWKICTSQIESFPQVRVILKGYTGIKEPKHTNHGLLTLRFIKSESDDEIVHFKLEPYTKTKTNISPPKIGRIPKGNFPTIHFQGLSMLTNQDWIWSGFLFLGFFCFVAQVS